MLIIGHRGAAGEKPENTLASIKAGRQAGADIIEFDVRLTKDGVPVLSHDATLERTHQSDVKIKDLTLKELKKRTAGSDSPICTLEEVFKDSLGKVMLNIELKDKNSGIATLELLRKPEYKGHTDMVFLSSFSVRELIRVRNLNSKIKLALLMHLNPFAFLAWERKLHLSAVGFHRLHINKIAVQAARQLDMFVYVYTVNRKGAIPHLAKKGVDGVATDYPSKFVSKSS